MFLAGIDTYSSTMRTVAIEGKGQDSSDSRSRRSSATWWRRAAAIQGGTAPALSVNHQSFTPPFETAVKRQTYEPLFISFQKYNRMMIATAEITINRSRRIEQVLSAKRRATKVGALL
ncbi:hypothetical protein ACJJTC_010501 [Scirpophaga incertulas]